MKHLRLYESFNEQDIHKICEKYRIRNYIIRPDGKVDVDDEVYLSDNKLKELPLNFGVVNGNFECGYNELTTLEGCPEVIHGNFWCSYNQLTTLEGCPEEVHGSFWCSNNKLTSLRGCPEIIHNDFYCNNNELRTLEGCPEVLHGNFWCSQNKLTTLEYGPIEVNYNFYFANNPLKNWKWAPELVSGEINYNLNIELDSVFKKFLSLNCGSSLNMKSLRRRTIVDNDKIIKYVLKEQSFYNIWKRDGSLNIPRFKQMMTESGLKIILPDDNT